MSGWFRPRFNIRPACKNQCKADYIATFYVDEERQEFFCRCGSYGLVDMTVNQCEQTIAQSAFYVYSHPPAAMASQMSKRQVRVQLANEKAFLQSHYYCPAGLTPCRVISSESQDYECLDTSTELESCGGCLYGSVDDTATIVGQDCSAITASELVRRRIRSRLVRAQAEMRSYRYCPAGLTPCGVDSSDPTAYECIDTSVELESCGGCLHGSMNDLESVLGQDCSMTGATLGHANCSQGRCVASACQNGLEPVEGTCL
ncbi:hypothetical protein IAU60_003292 [Kwoniella sp. DSM 27419]